MRYTTRKFFLIILPALLLLSSCRTYNMLDGKSRPVYFTADSSLFTDPDLRQPDVYYSDLLNLRGYHPNSLDLQKGESATAVISKPTFFNAYDPFLVYPGENILISAKGTNDYILKVKNGNKRRNRELLFFKTFQEIQSYPAIPQIDSFTIESFTRVENTLKKEIEKSTIISRYRFDSLLKTTHASRKFKRIANYYLVNKYNTALFVFYKNFKDPLEANGVFQSKLHQHIPFLNKFTKKEELEHQQTFLNELTDFILPYKISKLTNEAEFIACFTAITNDFTNITRDYLLSRLMYYANVRRIEIAPSYIEKYKELCQDETYKNLIAALFIQQEKNDEATGTISTNSLLLLNGKSVTSLEDIIKQYKGKLIVLDFWASWCVPCLKDIPHLKTIKKEYKNSNIAFVNISVDKEIQRWRKASIAINLEKKNNYLMIQPKQSQFIQQLEINTIPRYILIGKDGKIINDSMPRPSDPLFKKNLEKYSR